MIHDVEYLCIYLLASSISSLGKCLFNSFAHFLIRLFAGVFFVCLFVAIELQKFLVYLGINFSDIFSCSFSSVQSLSRVQLFATPWIAARQASLSITNSQSSPRLTSIESVMPSNHLILCPPLLLLPPIPPSIGVFQWVNSSHEVAKVLEFQL